MKKGVWILFFLSVVSLVVYRGIFLNFFTQDDFILINHFSQNNLWVNVQHVLGMDLVTHWRPLHDLFFLISGTLFGKNYFLYHLLMFAVHILSGLLIYKISFKIFNNSWGALASSLIYLTSSIHFVSLYWISGGATILGFTFLAASFYIYLEKKYFLSLLLFTFSILASEAMAVGVLIFIVWEVLGRKGLKITKPIALILLISSTLSLVHLAFFKPPPVSDSYRIEFSPAVFVALKYYLFRILGFVEGAGLSLGTFVQSAWLAVVVILAITRLNQFKKQAGYFLFSVTVILIGFFPFVVIPNHTSAHYMNISLWGFAMLIGLIMGRFNKFILTSLLTIFVILNIFNINNLENSNWVTKRSVLAKKYLNKIEADNPRVGSRLVFGDNRVSTSLEAYYALGSGEAINFWFNNKKYKTCFTFYQQCNQFEN